MPTSIMKWFDCKKGFGFLVSEAGADVFVHNTVIQAEGFRRLRAGDMVEYDLAHELHGLYATRVRLLLHVATGGKITTQYPMDKVCLPMTKTMDRARTRTLGAKL